MSIERENEPLLVQRAQQGDAAAFELLMQRHAQFVYNLALRTLQDAREAEDVAQEAFVRAWKALPRFRADAKFSTWIYRITTNLCYNQLPRMKRDLEALPDESLDNMSDNSVSAESQLLTSEFNDVVRDAIEQLPDSFRLLMTLRHLQGMSYSEIAAVTQMPLGTVKTGLFRARRQMRLALIAYDR